MVLTDRQFAATSRGLALGILAACQARQMTRDDMAAISSAALIEALGQLLGPMGAVDRLRDLADVMENQLIQEMN